MSGRGTSTETSLVELHSAFAASRTVRCSSPYRTLIAGPTPTPGPVLSRHFDSAAYRHSATGATVPTLGVPLATMLVATHECRSFNESLSSLACRTITPSSRRSTTGRTGSRQVQPGAASSARGPGRERHPLRSRNRCLAVVRDVAVGREPQALVEPGGGIDEEVES